MVNRVRKIYRFLKMFYIRKKRKLKNVHPTFYMSSKAKVFRDLKAGAYSYIGPNCLVYPKVSIGDYTMLANNVSIIGGDHEYKIPGLPTIFSGRGILDKTVIGKDVWLGAYVKIKTGVTIGDGAIVAMGSIVTKDLEPFSVYAGIPAKKIKNRFDNNTEIEKHKKMLEKNYIENNFNFNMLCN